MKTAYDTIKTQATPEYILSVFVDDHRHQCEYDPEACPDIELTFETTIADWRLACDLLEWPQLGKGLNECFMLDFPESKWKPLLEPSSEKKLKDLCVEIAKHTFSEEIKPTKLLGKTCSKAGIFLTIRSKLADAGADVSSLSPSTKLEEYCRNYWREFLKMSSHLFPGKFPLVKVSTPYYDFGFSGLCISFIAAVIGEVIGHFSDSSFSTLFTVVASIGVCLSTLLIFIAAFIIGPSSVNFGELQTFRDLVDCISEDDHINTAATAPKGEE